MVLPSYSFIFIFMPIVIGLYYFLNSRSLYLAGKIVLLASSLAFYFSLGYKGFLVCISSILICFAIGNFGLARLENRATAKLLLVLGIIINICLLLYCKYLTYFELILNKYTGTALTYKAVVVPVGISYFSFSQIAFLVDCYRNRESYSLVDYSLFVSFFPKITVGPIAFAGEMIPQFNDSSLKEINYTNMSKGFFRFTLGMSKKLLIADNLAPIVDIGYSNISTLGSTNALMIILAYTFQIYFDFSGYCDIAIGICQMLNLDLVDNFDAPYKSLSIAEFWKRWHITLTRFFRNYVYIPLGGNRKGKLRTYLNTMIIFLISGLWHGAATTFIVWGAVHGIGSIISKEISPFMKKLPKIIRWLLTFSFVSLAWVLFRAPDLATAMEMYKQLFMGGFKAIDINIVATCMPVEGQLIQWIVLKYASTYTYVSGSIIILALLAFSLFASSKMKTAGEMVSDFKANRLTMVMTVILFVWSVLSLSQVTEFIYVNF